MAKLTAKYDFRKDGTKNIKGYNLSLAKLDCEKIGFDGSTEIEIEYCKDRIILKKRGA